MASLFGFEIRRKQDTENLPSFTQEYKDDGAVVVAAGGQYGTYIDLDGTIRTEAELVSKYREMAQQPEIDQAIDDIVNDPNETPLYSDSRLEETLIVAAQYVTKEVEFDRTKWIANDCFFNDKNYEGDQNQAIFEDFFTGKGL